MISVGLGLWWLGFDENDVDEMWVLLKMMMMRCGFVMVLKLICARFG